MTQESDSTDLSGDSCVDLCGSCMCMTKTIVVVYRDKERLECGKCGDQK